MLAQPSIQFTPAQQASLIAYLSAGTFPGTGGGSSPRVVSVAYASTVTPNASTTDVLVIGALTGNLTLANPTGSPTDAQRLQVRVKQDGTGGRSVTLGSAYRVPASATPTWAAGASNTTYLLAEYNAVDSRWDVVSLLPMGA